MGEHDPRALFQPFLCTNKKILQGPHLTYLNAQLSFKDAIITPANFNNEGYILGPYTRIKGYVDQKQILHRCLRPLTEAMDTAAVRFINAEIEANLGEPDGPSTPEPNPISMQAIPRIREWLRDANFKVGAELIAEVVNGFVEPISWKTLVS